MNPHEHLHDIVAGFERAMLVTRREGGLHARPMAVAGVDGTETYFATSIDSPKVAEIEAEPRVMVTFQGNAQFASVEGDARIVRDPALIDRFWSSAWQIWFPGGKSDPSLCLLRIDPVSAEYWDGSGSQGLSYVFEGAKAVLQGRHPQVDESNNAKVEF